LPFLSGSSANGCIFCYPSEAKFRNEWPHELVTNAIN
jgi:hypothetical protein